MSEQGTIGISKEDFRDYGAGGVAKAINLLAEAAHTLKVASEHTKQCGFGATAEEIVSVKNKVKANCQQLWDIGKFVACDPLIEETKVK